MKKEKIKLYLDTSVYNRPFDDQNQIRIRLETEAFLLILEKAISKSFLIIKSSALLYENNQNPFPERKEQVLSYFDIASRNIKLNPSIKDRALLFESIGIDAMDALHIAYAEYGEAEYFLTCDDDIIKKVVKNKDIFKIEVCNPLHFILKEVFKNA